MSAHFQNKSNYNILFYNLLYNNNILCQDKENKVKILL